jgi:hypothetical protein
MFRITDGTKTLQGLTLVLGAAMALTEDADGFPKLDVGTGVVTSVFGRTGVVVAQTGDYTFAQIGSKPTTIAGYGITDTLTNTVFGRSGTVVANSGDYTFAQIGSKPTTVSGYGITDIVTQDGSRFSTNFNSLLTTGFYNASAVPTNSPGSAGYGGIIVAHGIDTGLQIYGGYLEDNLWFRGWHTSGATFTTWRKVWHDGNLASASTSATASTLAQRDSSADLYAHGFYAQGDWFRNNTSSTGLYNSANNNHWYSEGSGAYWTHAAPGSSGGIIMRAGFASTIHGYTGYWDSSGFGFLDYGGNWAVRINTTGTGAAGGQLYGDWTVRDIHAVRTTDGVIYLGNSGSRYLYYDGSSYQLVNAAVHCPDFILA